MSITEDWQASIINVLKDSILIHLYNFLILILIVLLFLFFSLKILLMTLAVYRYSKLLKLYNLKTHSVHLQMDILCAYVFIIKLMSVLQSSITVKGCLMHKWIKSMLEKKHRNRAITVPHTHPQEATWVNFKCHIFRDLLATVDSCTHWWITEIIFLCIYFIHVINTPNNMFHIFKNTLAVKAAPQETIIPKHTMICIIPLIML